MYVGFMYVFECVCVRGGEGELIKITWCKIIIQSGSLRFGPEPEVHGEDVI